MTTEAVSAAARRHIRPDDSIVVVVGDASLWREQLGTLGRPVEDAEIEF